jgi:hypothetical protein
MIKIALIAVLCLTATFALPSKVRFQDTKTLLAEMDQDKFGATMLSAVQMNVAAENPIEEITLLIEEILE